jgi:hypothetical protein
MSSGEYHKQGQAQLKSDRQFAQDLELQLAAKYERWSELEAKSALATKN